MVLSHESLKVVVEKVLAAGQGNAVSLFLSSDCVSNVDFGKTPLPSD